MQTVGSPSGSRVGRRSHPRSAHSARCLISGEYMSHLSTARSRGTVLIAAAAILALGASTGAVAGSLITSSQIKNNTIRSADVKNGAIKMRDLAPGVRAQV